MTHPQLASAPPSTATSRSGWVLGCLSVCAMLVVGFVASINLAAPLLAASTLHPSSAQLLWIIDIYVVIFACLVIPAGALGDRYGRKGLLVIGLLTFAAGAIVSATSGSIPVMLTGRVITGVGAACVLPNSLAVLIHTTAPERRSRAIAVWAASTGVGGVIGNVGGGAILETGSWRWLFATVAPLAAACAGWVAAAVPRTGRSARSLNPRSCVLLTAATLALLVGIIQAPENGWASPTVWGAFLAAAGLGAGWAWSELRSSQPLLDPRLFRIPGVRAGALGMMTAFFGSFGLFYLNASLLQYGRGYSVLQTGLAVVPMTVPMLLGSRWVPDLVERVGMAITLAVAFVAIGGGLLGLSTTGSSGYPVYVLWLVVVGVGLAVALPSLTAELTSALPREKAGVGAGLQATTRELGSALGVAVVGTVLSAEFSHRLSNLLGSDTAPRTVAQALAETPLAQHPAVLQAFSSGAFTALRLAGVVVLLAGALVVWQATRARRR